LDKPADSLLDNPFEKPSGKQVAIIIYNPLAGRGKGQHYAQLAKSKLKQQNWEVLEVIATEYAGHAETDIVPTWSEKVDVIIVVAGDGTLREVVTGLLNIKSNTLLGFVPLGNANVVAREFGIPLNPEHAIAGLPGYEIRTADVGLFKTQNQTLRYFLAMVEVGQGAKVVHLVDQLRQGVLKRIYRWWGDLVYIIAGLMALKKEPMNDFSLKVENNDKQSGYQRAVFACMETYSKGWSMTPGAKCDDGELDFSASKRSDFIAFTSQTLASAQRRKINRDWMRYGKGQQFDVIAKKPMFIQADGDAVDCSDSLHIEVIPCAYRILAPSISNTEKK